MRLHSNPLCARSNALRGLIQPVQKLRRRIIARCLTHKTIGDVGPYGSVLECFAELCLMVKPKQVPKPQKKTARELRDNLKGLFSVYEEHAKNGGKGLGGIIHAALSGVDCIAAVKRARESCVALQKTEEKSNDGGRRPRGSGGSRGYRGSYSKGGSGRAPNKSVNMQNVKCHNCYQFGHYSSGCKREQAEPKK